jgi:DNA-binding protein
MDENTGFTGSKPSMNYVLAIAAQFNAQTPIRSRRRPEAERQPVLSML